MRICQPHWDRLRQALANRGLDHLGAKTSEQAFENMAADVRGEVHPYDPLMDCHWMIVSRALDIGGLYLLGLREDGGQHCPICEAVKFGQSEDDWIDGPADTALRYCREASLIPAVS